VSRITALAAVFSLFVVGVLVGGFAVHLYYAEQPRGGWDRGERFRSVRFVERLERDLSLTTEQRARIDEILQQARIESDRLHRELVPRVREHMERTRAEIRDVLTPEQQAKFDALRERYRERAEHFLLGRGARGHGPPRRGRPPGGGPPPPPDE
jgi:Spy/CpxP family protein refolding chaperone